MLSHCGCKNLDSRGVKSVHFCGVYMDYKLYWAEKALAAKGVCGHAPPENFYLKHLGNAISQVSLQTVS